INMMNYYAEQLDHKEYKALVNEQYRNSAHSHILSVALDYLEQAFDSGIEKAYERFKFYMPSFSGERSLHSFPAIKENEATLESEGEHKIKKSRLIKVIKTYYKFHKT